MSIALPTMDLGFDVDEPSSCSICRATAESFTPYHESKPNLEPVPHWRLKLGNPIAIRDQTSCSTCQKVWDVLLDYESRYNDRKRENSWFSDDDELEITFSRLFGYELSRVRVPSASSPGLESRLYPTSDIILQLRPHIPFVLRFLSESDLAPGQDISLSKRSNSQVVDNQYPTWYARSENGGQYKFAIDDPSPPLDFGVVLPEGPIDTLRIRRWIEYCDKFHEKCRPHLHGAPQSEVMPAFLIDVKQLCIVPCPSTQTKYATLSYVWGQVTGTIESKHSNLQNLCRHNSLSSEEFGSLIPRTIRDAIKLCQLIGIDFLWVDRLCIVQDDKNMVHDQIGAMGKIFKNSYLTIICADGEDVHHGLPGVDDTSRKHEPALTLRFSSSIQFSVLKYKESETSPHHQRAWTFQERMLSPRTLVFHDKTVYWECLSCSIQETCSADDDGEHGFSSTQWMRGGSHTGRTQEFPAFAIPESLVLSERPIPDLKVYWDLVRGYSKRSLSYQSDAEKAFGAVIQDFSRAFDGGFFYGIPTLIFDYCLFWSFAPGSVPKRRREFPSWSWLGWETEVLLNPFRIDPEDVWKPSKDYFPEREALDDRKFWLPKIAFYRTRKDGARVLITNPSFKCVHPQKCKYTEGWRAHLFLYFEKKDESGFERVFYPDRDNLGNVHERNITKDRLVSTEEVEEKRPADLQSWSKRGAVYFLHDNWPNKRFFHPFPVVNHPETEFESSKNWEPYLEFRAHSYTLKPVKVYDSHYKRRALLLEHEAFPGVIVGDLQPDNPQEVDSLLGSSCQVVITSIWCSGGGEFNTPYLLHSEYFTPAKWVYATLWIEWKDGVAYRKGVGAIFGPADPKRPVAADFSVVSIPMWQKLDDTVKRGVDLIKEWPAELVDVRLG